jgi:hypothetical protein
MSDQGKNENLDQKLQAAIDAMPREIEPDRDLWAGIEARISMDRAGNRPGIAPWGIQGIAAAVALVALTALVTLWIADLTVQPDQPVAVVTEPVPYPLVVPAALKDSEAFDDKYQKQRQEMIDLLDQSLATMTPETRAKVEDNLKQINRALSDISDALSGDPDNILLQQLLLTMYQEELAVFENVNHMTRILPPRTET